MKKPKIPPQVTDVLFELGIELLKTLQDLNAKGKLKLPRKSKKKGVPNDNTTTNTDRNSKEDINLSNRDTNH